MAKIVTIVGLGYVGLPLACLCAEKGLKVYGLEVDQNKADLINAGKSPIEDDQITKSLNDLNKSNKKIIATIEPSECIPNSDAVIVCVPTPITKDNFPDFRAVTSAVFTISKEIRKKSLLVIESTIHPGTVEEIVVPILKKENIDPFKNDVYLVHCPERIDPGNKKWTIETLPRVVGGITKEATKEAAKFYRSILKAEVMELSHIKSAEATKIMENTFRDVNIAFINEMAQSFDKAGIDIMEVIKGASTKPFAFMPHYPGAGVGGHCFDKNTNIFLKNSGHLKIKRIGPYIESLDCKKQVVNDSQIFYPENVKVLSFDMIKNKTSFKPVTIASRRKTKDILEIKCSYNYNLKVTDLHPVILYDKGLKVKLAKDLKAGDKLILNKLLPSENRNIQIDIIENLNSELVKKIRVKPINKSFEKFRDIIDKNIKGDKKKYYRDNILPLRKYLEIEHLLKIRREDISLCAGRGQIFKKFPAIFKIDKDFFRLIGYYLSEGCITKDMPLRIIFTFNKNEKEYIDDLKQIVKKLDFDYSDCLSKISDSYNLKVSSYLFGFLLRDILKCGVSSYDKQIPEMFFDIEKPLKEEILKGMFRGRGDVSWYSGETKYAKNSKVHKHSNNNYNDNIKISYFTSSKVLFQQLVLFLLNMDITPRLSKRGGYLTISGTKYALKARDWFLGEKREKIKNYLRNMKKDVDYKKIKIYRDFIAIEVEKIKPKKAAYVYSFEVEDTNTLVTSNGIIAHNCIPVDPYYLIEKAKQIGFDHKFLSLARQINNNMPKYAVECLEIELSKLKKSIEGAKVGVLGLAYKPDVDDTRESPSREIIRELKEKNAFVLVYDPFVEMESTAKDFNDILSKCDYIILATDHTEFKNMDLKKLKENHIKVVIDGRNCLDKENIKSMGILYHGIGRS